ncbi:hypothetical protein A2311_04580 [candidate division WOR-1 bacterium RIFOXYB2_FULL_48_7]|uniref:Indole-3-glycerol phosphate synthase n=1 Tax=candidate division WOR-1 bacterium RIFOXYB2_FULL_48_7 TaxID=1802583 RepID=A0A1F4TS29_UNCSA|nr:MAG: hypothetical protein A2311_04580 [candidate division WOR-1 bacterium RIFOXYB2_FULL_48_7]
MILDEIVFNKRQEVTALKVHLKLPQAKKLIKQMPRTRKFAGQFPAGKISLIAEIKKASPSAGLLVKRYNPAALAKQYAKSGAAAISVLTDNKYFQGSIGHLAAVKKSVKLPVLRKDFIIDSSQLYESRLAGADAVLLIVRILTPQQLRDLLQLAGELGLEALVETHDEREVAVALQAGAACIGLNNRDLQTLRIDLETSLMLLAKFPELKDKIVVAESGIKSAHDVQTLRSQGVRGILVGESLLSSGDIPRKVKELLS